ncbi:hypothetical protein PAXRUDRAFT_214442 [Paxillus rubicundulus Ve08.2h10]|uniref:Uncharacterized protein n=1 Tax=Paxillus rubicundulus Ve08.2h10 TaxID=930991 RepID=A0A0D0E1B2_9AGAM|nr:hypothetical protein PAXRUDRAFT_214442 [Paxillus rubicundulus Ve08.2h10]
MTGPGSRSAPSHSKACYLDRPLRGPGYLHSPFVILPSGVAAMGCPMLFVTIAHWLLWNLRYAGLRIPLVSHFVWFLPGVLIPVYIYTTACVFAQPPLC